MERRRLIGRRFDDETVKKDIKSWPFKIVDQGGNPFVEVDYLGETKKFSPQEISAMILGKVRPTPSLLSASLIINILLDERYCRNKDRQESSVCCHHGPRLLQ